MTYWVIAKFKKGIYLSADVRASRPQESNLASESPLMQYSDTSEKLFALEYTTQSGVVIKIGLCTSGFAGIKGCTIADIIKQYLNDLLKQKTLLQDAKVALEDMISYISRLNLVNHFGLNQQEVNNFLLLATKESGKQYANLSECVIHETCFGLGMLIEPLNSPSWWGITTWNGASFQWHNNIGYVEAAFNPLCLSAQFGSGTLYKDLQGHFLPRNALDSQEKLENFDPQEFLAGMIWTAAKAGVISENASQSISADKADFAALPFGKNVVKELYPKADVTTAKMENPLTYGSDLTFPPPQYSFNPLNDPGRMSISSRQKGNRGQLTQFGVETGGVPSFEGTLSSGRGEKLIGWGEGEKEKSNYSSSSSWGQPASLFSSQDSQLQQKKTALLDRMEVIKVRLISMGQQQMAAEFSNNIEKLLESNNVEDAEKIIAHHERQLSSQEIETPYFS